MKKILRNLVYRLLVLLAKIRLKRLRGVKIIGVTGSAGKTTTKDAIYTVLSRHFKVIANKKSYNTEFGLPLTILGADAGFSSPVLWALNILKAKWNAFFSMKKVDFFVLEMGVDKPGDMQDLTAIVRPDIAIFSNVKPVHLNPGQFKNLKETFEEKSYIVKNLKKNGVAILNFDDEKINGLKAGEGIKTIFFGQKEGAKLRATDINMDLKGLSFVAEYGHLKAEIHAPILGKHHVYCILPAIACGLECGMYMNEIADALKGFHLEPGRMSLIQGINGSMIIDSSYNASPESTVAALDTLNEVAKTGRKIFVFGNMNELGEGSGEYHKIVGKHAAKIANIMITVGEMAEIAAKEALKQGMKHSDVHFFMNSNEASEFIKKIIKPEDTILVKGSQNKVRLERLVKAVMLYPEMATQLLCRQEKTWQKIQ